MKNWSCSHKFGQMCNAAKHTMEIEQIEVYCSAAERNKHRQVSLGNHAYSTSGPCCSASAIAQVRSGLGALYQLSIPETQSGTGFNVRLEYPSRGPRRRENVYIIQNIPNTFSAHIPSTVYPKPSQSPPTPS